MAERYDFTLSCLKIEDMIKHSELFENTGDVDSKGNPIYSYKRDPSGESKLILTNENEAVWVGEAYLDCDMAKNLSIEYPGRDLIMAARKKELNGNDWRSVDIHCATCREGNCTALSYEEYLRETSNMDMSYKNPVYYLNFNNNNPVNPCMKAGTDTYDMQCTVPVEIDLDATTEDRIVVKFLNNYDIKWTGGYEDNHTEHYIKGEGIVLPKNAIEGENAILTLKPVFEAASPMMSKADKIRQDAASKVYTPFNVMDETSKGVEVAGPNY